MGPSGAGKSVVGAALAQRLGVPFIDADDLHPPRNKAKMAAGTPLDDADRWPWLDLVARAARDAAPVVVACSALRRAYRDRLRGDDDAVVFVELVVDREVLAQRLSARDHEFMPASLLASQLGTLEPLEAGEPGIRFPGTEDVAATGDADVEASAAAIAARLRDGDFGIGADAG